MVICGKAEKELPKLGAETVDLIWTDPPFNTGTVQKHSKGAKYRDAYTDFGYRLMLTSVIAECHRVLKPTGSMFMLLDFRSVHDVKTWIDPIFGRKNFRGELIWHSELGASRQHGKGWTVRHYTSLWYTKTGKFKFDFSKVPRVARKAPKKGYEGDKPISSVWTYTLSNTHRERVAYPNQKPLAIISPLVEVHTDPGDVCLDPFAGSGSLAEAAVRLGRGSIAIDSNPESVRVINDRLKAITP